MSAPQIPAHPSRIEVCARSFTVRRTHGLALALEERFGPIGPLLARVRGLQFAMADYRDLLVLLLAGQPDAPEAAEIDAWIFQAGVQQAAIPAAKVIMALFIGSAEADRLEAKDESEEAAESLADPRPASSAGTGSSARPMPSDGGPPSSGAPPSSSSARPSPPSAA